VFALLNYLHGFGSNAGLSSPPAGGSVAPTAASKKVF